MTQRTVKFLFCFFLILPFYKAYAQECDLEFSLGNDTTLNCNSSVTLTGPEGFNYLWSTNATTQSINVSQAGQYSLQIIEQQESEVINGDFSDGTNGFTSDYVIGTGGSWGQLSLEGTYAVSSNSMNVHTNFVSCFDHTTDDASGAMLIVNGASVADQDIWTQTITITPNTEYVFSIWGMSVVGSNPGQLNFSINGDQFGETFELNSFTCLWENFLTTWNSGSNTTATIAIVNQNTSTSGNDFALDDISFAPICSFTDTIEVALPTLPVLTVSENQTICVGDSVTLEATSDIPNSTFTWQPGNLSGSEITVAPEASVQYTAIATSPQECNSTPQSVIITVDQGPDIAISATDTICPGQTTVLTASSDTDDMTYLWTPGDISGNTLEVSPDETTEYTVTGTPEVGCPGSANFTLNVRNPSVSISGTELICPGQTIELTAEGNYSEFEYNWSPGGLSGDTIEVSPDETTEYTVSATSDAGCEATADFTVEVEPAVITISGDSEICPHDTAALSATASFPGFSFQWNPGSIYGADIEVIPTSTTTYTISGSSSLGCTAQAEYTVTVSAIPNAEISGPSEICSGEEITLNATADVPNPFFVWNNDSTGSQIIESPGSTTEYSVVAFDGNCPSAPAFHTVTVKPVPIVFPPNDTLVCPETPLVVTATANIPDGSYFWTPTDQTGDTITIDPVNPGFYTVSVEKNGCTSVERYFEVDLLESCGCTLEIPNVFTPNGDGKNDGFRPMDDDECQYTGYTLTVFNRWGKEIFRTSDFSESWDGTIDGNTADDGVYFWTFTYEYTDGSLKTGSEARSGEVTLVNQ